MSQRNIRTEIKDAASVEAGVSKFIKEELRTIESADSLLCQVRIGLKSEFPKWASTLAAMLCTNPELANLTNEKLAGLIENEDGQTGFDYTIMSKKLSVYQRDYAGEILRNHGYATDTLVKGTDIKRIVKNDIRTETDADDGVVFFADGVSIDGTMYKYRQREVTPSGNPWHDFRIRVAGHDTPLQTVLKLRGISIGEFLKRDKAAQEFASTEHTVKRQQLDRKPKKSNAINKLIAATEANTSALDNMLGFVLKGLATASIGRSLACTIETEPGAAYIDNRDGTLTKITTPDANLPWDNLSASEPATAVRDPYAHESA